MTSTGKSSRTKTKNKQGVLLGGDCLFKDPDSSAAAFYFATAWNYFVTISIVVTILQGGESPMLPPSTEGLIQICVEAAETSKLSREQRVSIQGQPFGGIQWPKRGQHGLLLSHARNRARAMPTL